MNKSQHDMSNLHKKIVKYFRDSKTENRNNKQAQDAWNKCVEDLEALGYTNREIYQAKIDIFPTIN